MNVQEQAAVNDVRLRESFLPLLKKHAPALAAAAVSALMNRAVSH